MNEYHMYSYLASYTVDSTIYSLLWFTHNAAMCTLASNYSYSVNVQLYMLTMHVAIERHTHIFT